MYPKNAQKNKTRAVWGKLLEFIWGNKSYIDCVLWGLLGVNI